MEPEDIKKTVDEVIELVKDVPEPYRLTAFQVILQQRLSGVQPVRPGTATGEKEQESWDTELPIDVEAFLNEHSLSIGQLKRLFVVHEGGIGRSYDSKVDTSNRTDAQIQLSLLTALEHALEGRGFAFSFDELRDRTDDLGIFDTRRFKERYLSHENLFNGFDDESNVTLSTDGMVALANLIAGITHE